MPPADDDAALTLKATRQGRREILAHLEPVTGEDNIFAHLLAGSHVRTYSILSRLPFQLLIN